MLKLVRPTMAHRERAIDFINELRLYGSEINGSGSLDSYLAESTYEAWLEKLNSDTDIANVPEERAPSLTYFFVRQSDDRIVGCANLRLALNDFWRAECGHIGYCVRPTERGRHYATEMLRQALKVYRRLGIHEIILTCAKTNPASAKVIMNCGGVFDAEFDSAMFNETIQRYIIRH